MCVLAVNMYRNFQSFKSHTIDAPETFVRKTVHSGAKKSFCVLEWVKTKTVVAIHLSD